MLKGKKGITLIALIITIIVLLILAGISISLVVGDNGVLTRATSSKEKTDVAQIQEEIQLAWSSVEADGIPNKWSNEQKRAALQEELRKQDSSATATLENDVITINYKNSTMTINAGNGSIANVDVGDTTNWDTIKTTATKHPDQKASNDIGIDANGKICNLDLWEYEEVGNSIHLNCIIYTCYENSCYVPHQYGWDESPYFSDDVELENIVCPQYIKIEGEDNFKSVTNFDVFASLAFDSDLLKTIKLPSTLEELPALAFYNCTNLESIVIPDSVKIIKDGAFSGCTSLASITFPSTPMRLSGNVFSGCTSLLDLTIPSTCILIVDEDQDENGDGEDDNDESIQNFSMYQSPIVNLTVNTDIPANMCYVALNLETLNIGPGCTSIGEGAFSCCTSLSSVEIANTVTKIASRAFGGTSSLTSFTIPSSVESTYINFVDTTWYLYWIPGSSTSEVTCAHAPLEEIYIDSEAFVNTIYAGEDGPEQYSYCGLPVMKSSTPSLERLYIKQDIYDSDIQTIDFGNSNRYRTYSFDRIVDGYALYVYNN